MLAAPVNVGIADVVTEPVPTAEELGGVPGMVLLTKTAPLVVGLTGEPDTVDEVMTIAVVVAGVDGVTVGVTGAVTLQEQFVMVRVVADVTVMVDPPTTSVVEAGQKVVKSVTNLVVYTTGAVLVTLA